MGATLPKACDSTVIDRQGVKGFDIAVAEVNGWRTDMEDAHLIYLTEDVGVFGVYDGHGGKDCSKFAARRIYEELEKNGVPEEDAAWEELFIRIDKEFLDSDMTSGTTATMCVVRKPKKAGEKHKLHVVNAGDSRTLLGKADGTIVDGGGTDKGLTRDHKPEDPEERKRIIAAGATVENDRVNGNLSVCRGFGDRDEKVTGGPGPDNRPVSCIPEQYHVECDETDFVLLVCDGVSEGNFSNSEVVELVAKSLKEGKNGGQAARLVCLQAIEKDSKDNITCMVVQLQGDKTFDRNAEFIAGSVTKLTSAPFRKAYTFMADKAHLSLAEAVAMRNEVLQAELDAASEPKPQELLDEAEMLGTPDGAPDSEERKKWAEKWLEENPETGGGGGDGPGGMDMSSLMGMLGGGGAGGVDMGMLQSILGKGGKGKGKAAGDHLSQLTSLRSDHSSLSSSQAAMTKRMTDIEQVVNEKHSAELEAHKVVHGQIQIEHATKHGGAVEKIEEIFKNNRSVEDRIVYLERIIGDSAEQHTKEVSSLRMAHGNTTTSVRDVLGKHVALQDRMEYIEKAVDETAEKHDSAMSTHQSKLEQLYSKISEQEKDRAKQSGDLSATREELEHNHATIEGRLAYMEKAVGESFASHASELGNIRDAHSKLNSDSRAAQARQGTFDERLDYIEHWLRGFKVPDVASPLSQPSREAAIGLRPRSALT